ncbi:ABC transporter permease [Citrobacter freundii]|nr:ABC transporter permease [Citrobacter freundii]MBC6508499.1 ABC transporter permease [Citrobacter freundii]
MARNGWEVEQAVIKALFLREIKTRFGKYRLGYAWAILEPVAHLLVLIAVFGYIMQRTLPDISFPVFLLNGLIPYFLFVNVVSRSMNAIEANKGLFNYRPVKPIDTVIARSLLEVLIYGCVYLVLVIIVIFIGEGPLNIRLSELILVWLFLVIFSFGIGVVVMVTGAFSHEIAKVIPVIMKPLYFFSCVMFPLSAVPENYRFYLLWNPLVHVVELSRQAVVTGYSSEGATLSFLALCSLVSLFTGLILYRYREEAMLTS